VKISRIQRLQLAAGLVVAVAIVVAVPASSDPPSAPGASAAPVAQAVPYPDGFRRWAHVKTGAVTAANTHFSVIGGFHHIYANPAALAGYASGRFADGSVLVFDRLAIEENAGTLNEGQRIVVDVMVKDAAKWPATGGWGFEEFAGSSATQRNVGANAKATCFDCHATSSPGSFVVSKLRD